jgi:hypothetical protein
MTREQALRRLQELSQNDDPEADHSEADRILCDLLIALGMQDVVDAWRAIEKWYA